MDLVRLAERARELMLSPEDRNSYVALCHALGDDDGHCPSCGDPVTRYETDVVNHVRRCATLRSDAN